MVFLGGTIGNFAPAERAAFLADLAATLDRGEHLLLGTDLVKDVARLEAAYDDAAGVTAAFNLNVLRVVNRELDGDFDLDAFEHVAFFDTDRRVDRDAAPLPGRPDGAPRAPCALTVDFAAGEEMRTEISAKFRREGVEAELEAAGFQLGALDDRRSRRLRPLARPPGLRSLSQPPGCSPGFLILARQGGPTSPT